MSRCAFLASRSPPSTGYITSTFKHRASFLGQPQDAEINYYPPRGGKVPKDVIVFFPGNPGLIAYYPPFLLDLQSRIPPSIGIIAHSHLGHSPSIRSSSQALTLGEQVEAKVEFINALRREVLELREKEGLNSQDEQMRIGLMGHSVGAEMVVQVMKALDTQESSTTFPVINAAFLLFPTLAHIAQTPNGRRLQPIFHTPLIQLLPFLCYIIKPLVWLLRLASTLSKPTSSSIYAPNRTTLSMLNSPSTVHHVLRLARSEMETITTPDLEWYATEMKRDKCRLWSYWGKDDGWVADKGDEIKAILKRTGRAGGRVEEETSREAEVEERNPLLAGGKAVQVVDCVDSVPHAFCLAHSSIIATKVAHWINQAFK